MKYIKKYLLAILLFSLFFVRSEVTYISTEEPEIKKLGNQKEIELALEEIYKREKKFDADASYMYYPDLSNLIKQHNLKTGVEIGVLYGGNSEWLLNNANLEKLYSIDPYEHSFYGWKLLADLMFYKTQKKLKKFNTKNELIRKTSLQASKEFLKHSIDFVFIDGDHNYGAVAQDIQIWFEKVKNKGLVIGDDYHQTSPGVIQAVDEFCKLNNYKINQIGVDGRIWWFQK